MKRYIFLISLIIILFYQTVEAQQIEVRYPAHSSLFSSSYLEGDSLLINLSNTKNFKDANTHTFLKQVSVYKHGSTLSVGNYISNIDTNIKSLYHSEIVKKDSTYFTFGHFYDPQLQHYIFAYYKGASKIIDTLHYPLLSPYFLAVGNVKPHPLNDSSVLIMGSLSDSLYKRSAYILEFNLITNEYELHIEHCNLNWICEVYDLLYDSIQNSFIAVTGMPLGPNPDSSGSPAFAYFDPNFNLDASRCNYIDLSYTPFYSQVNNQKPFQINVAIESINDSTVIVVGDVSNPSVMPGNSTANSYYRYGDDIAVSLRRTSDFSEVDTTMMYGKRDTGETQNISVDLLRRLDSNLYIIATTLDQESFIETWDTELSLLGFDENGQKHWMKYYPFNDYCYVLDLHPDNKGGVWVVAQCSENRFSWVDWFVKAMYIDSVAYWPRNNQTVGISNELGNWDRDFKIFPNPASESVIIRQYGQLQLLDAEIYDPNGRKVKEFQLNQIDNEINLSELSSGIYYVRISFKGQYLSTEKVLLK